MCYWHIGVTSFQNNLKICTTLKMENWNISHIAGSWIIHIHSCLFSIWLQFLHTFQMLDINSIISSFFGHIKWLSEETLLQVMCHPVVGVIMKKEKYFWCIIFLFFHPPFLFSYFFPLAIFNCRPIAHACVY